ncbi:acyltransferase family protein [Actinomycetospora atypica]|uniref:Acyltransferase family protein n=1 Tax=Actinomycetospora atypica TaxID=1290095 RepID=A0ABV9YLD1_9PSEU
MIAPATAPLTRTAAPATTSRQDPTRFRPELQGLRALACGLVVIYHVWSDRVSGGVDVFFVITGFLFAGQLVRAAERGAVDVLGTWGRMLRRLVPTTAVVLLGCIVGGWLIVPESRWPQTIREVTASAFFVENWRLAADSVDYYAAHNTASIVQHLWSLSIQGQFYLVFPLFVGGLALLARRLRVGPRRVVLVALAVVSAASLAYSVHLTAVDQTLAYFHSLTRVWEFALGGLLGLLMTRVALPTGVRVAAGWTGVVALAVCGIVLDVEGGFPGYYALWPVLAACLVLAAERTGTVLGADHWLSSRPMQYLGRISFPLYLWHWPVLLLALLATHRETAGMLGGLLVVAVSLVLAALTDRLVDQPMARARRWRGAGYRSGAIAVCGVLLVTLGWHAVTTVRAEPSGVPGDLDHPGAAALTPGFVYHGAPSPAPIPPAVSAYEDWVHYEDDCARPAAAPRLERCTWVAPTRPDAPTVVVVGDSHMQQFLPALAPVARQRGWRVDTLIRPGCPFSTTSESNVGEVECIEWNRAAIDEIMRTRPSAVVVQASHGVRPGPTEATGPGMVEAWQILAGADIPILAVRDNPRYGYAPSSCVDNYRRGAPECDVPRAELYGPAPPISRVALPPTVSYLDLADRICGPRTCDPEVGNVTVYLDDNHLTATFSSSLAPVVGPRLAALVDR